MKLSRPLPWVLATAVLSALAGGLMARMLAQKTVALQGGTWLPQPRALAPFTLTDVNGRPYGNAALNGHPSLLFFGYTYCPDVCPNTLAMLREVQRRLPLPGLQVLFISVDPERDTPAVLKAYLGSFDADFIGLHAEHDALTALLHDLAAEATREPTAGASYRLAHSATLYLLDTRGRMVAVYSPPVTAAVLTADLRSLARASLL